MHLDHLSAYGICGQIFIGRLTKSPVMNYPSQKRPEMKCPVHETSGHETCSHETSCHKTSATKCPAMKRPDQLDHLYCKCDRKLTILLPHLSACGICAKMCKFVHNSARSWPRHNFFWSFNHLLRCDRTRHKAISRYCHFNNLRPTWLDKLLV